MPTDELTALESDESTESVTSKPPRFGLLAGVAVLLAIGALALSALAWLEGHDSPDSPDAAIQAELQRLQQDQDGHSRALADLSAQLEGVSASVEAAAAGEVAGALAGQAEQISALSEALENQERYNRSLQQAVEALQTRLTIAETGLAARAPSLADAPARLDIATVDYLLRLAPQRLTLFHDVRSADQALVEADAQLAAMENPIYIGLRQHIADARQALASTELPNSIEISARLDAVQQRLAGLTFGVDGVSNSPAAPADQVSNGEEQGWWARLKASLSGLVTVRRNAADAGERLTLEDKDMLRQGLWMQLEGARLALMRHDQEAWEHTLARADEVLERWFDSGSEEALAVKAELRALSEIPIDPQLPDISGPWAQLQLISQASGIPAETAAATQAASRPAAQPEPDPKPEPEPEPEPVTEDDLPEIPETESGEDASEPGQADDSG